MPQAEEGHNSTGSAKWYWVALLLVIIGSAAIRGRLVSMPLERDEGEYAYIAQEMLKGVSPYVSAYSMKLPGIYAVYAVIIAVFGQTQTGIHTGLIVFNAATILAIFLLAKRMFGGLAGVAAGCAYAILSTVKPSLGLTANAEHFVLLPALVGILILTWPAGRRRLLVDIAAGLFFGLAFVTKQHGILFAVFGALYLLCRDLRRPVKWKGLIAAQIFFGVGVLLPFAAVCFLYWRAGLFDEFWFWTFTYARDYATTVPLEAGWYLFRTTLGPIVTGSFLIWLFALAGVLTCFIRKSERKYLPFMAGFLIFSFLAVCPGLYFRGHYFILFFPAAAVAAGAGFNAFCKFLMFLSCFISDRLSRLIVIIAGLIIASLTVVGVSLYQQRLYLFELTPMEVCRYFYDGNPFPESLEIAEYLKANSRPDDKVAILGSEPQIYFYANRRAATGFIYVYPLMETHPYAQKMQGQMIKEIEAAGPRWLVFVKIQSSWIERPESVKDIFIWFDAYVNSYYDLAGVAEMSPEGQTIYRWKTRVADYNPASEHGILVFKRKASAAN